MPLSVDEVILVDGNSTDRTVEVARAIRPDIVVVNEPGRGKGTAMRAGFAAARGAYVVVLDADGSMDPADVDRFVEALEAGADLVKGSRYIAGGASSDLTFIRSLGNRLLLFASNLIYGQRFTELCYGFMALRRSRIDELRLIATGFEIETEIVCRSVVQGFRITELPSLEAERISGESNLHAVRDGLRVVRTMLRCAVSETVAPATEPVAAAHLPTAFERFEELVVESQRVPVKAEVSIVD
jgi:glycosyltransferase involved in cell wall biosynthesis